jgi:hypothetical protein
MYVCMYVACIYVCLYASMHVCVYVCIYAFCVRTYVYMYVCKHVCSFLWGCVCVYVFPMYICQSNLMFNVLWTKWEDNMALVKWTIKSILIPIHLHAVRFISTSIMLRRQEALERKPSKSLFLGKQIQNCHVPKRKALNHLGNGISISFLINLHNMSWHILLVFLCSAPLRLCLFNPTTEYFFIHTRLPRKWTTHISFSILGASPSLRVYSVCSCIRRP